MEYIGTTLCVSARELTRGDDPVMSKGAYDQYIYRNKGVRMRRGSAAGPALLAWHGLRPDIQQRFREKIGDPAKLVLKNMFEDAIKPDHEAARYFSEYELEDGRHLLTKVQVECTLNACILNALITKTKAHTGKVKVLGNSTGKIFKVLARQVNELDRERWPHTLPGNAIRLKEKMKEYAEQGYACLIHRGFGNGNSRKVNALLERLLLSLYCQKNLPFGEWVHDDYLKFIAGEIGIVDGETGEMYDRKEFFDEKKGTYVTISKATVWNVLSNPDNEAIIDRMRNNRIDHITHLTPYNHRHNPAFSLAKVSADDRTLSRKTSDGIWLNAYAVFDVLSGACLSCVYSTDKPNLPMVYECFREMYRTLDRHELMWPGELECENHLMREIEEELRAMFTYVTFTTPGISRNKRAEHSIRALKYGSEKRLQEGVGRWNGKGPYKIKSEKKDEDYKQVRLPVERLIAEAKEAVEHHNGGLHPDQKKYTGKTRWQVLMENVHPDLGRPQKYKLFRYMGKKTETSLRNNDFVRVQYQDYAIDSYNILSRMKPNNYQVDAYYVPDAAGEIGEVYLYQGDVFLTRASQIETYNEARIERTERDEQIRTEQAKRQAHYFKRERELAEKKINRKIVTLPMTQVRAIERIEPEVVEHVMINRDEVDLEAAFAKFNSETWTERKIGEL